MWGRQRGDLGGGERAAELARGVPGKPCYLGGKAVGNPTMMWVEKLWDFRLRRDKGCLWGLSTGVTCRGLVRGQREHDFWRRRRWVPFPTSLAEAPCASHRVRH